MTHPLLERTESRIQAEIVAYLEVKGWDVHVFSSDRKRRRQLAGWPDIVAFRYGVTLLVEVKTDLGRLRPAQLQFAAGLEPHLWSTLRYVVARDLADVAHELGDGVI